MLVCSVSQLRRRAAIAADVAEAAIALDSPGTGNVVFATLVDDPASVGEFVDAYLGEIMLEAASSADATDAGLAYATAIVEAAGAAEVQSAAFGATFAVLDAGTASGVALSNGNRTETVNASPNFNGARSISYQTGGKYYFEFTCGTLNGNQNAIGIIASTETYFNAMNNNANCSQTIGNTGNIISNGAGSGMSIGSWGAAGTIIGVAIDLTARKCWF